MMRSLTLAEVLDLDCRFVEQSGRACGGLQTMNVVERLRNEGFFVPCGAIEALMIDGASEGAAEMEWNYQIPIEIVHEHLVRTSWHPLIAHR